MGSSRVNKGHGIVKLRKRVEDLGRENELLKNFRAFSSQGRAGGGSGSSRSIGGGSGSIEKACEVLDVSKSGYYEYLGQRGSDARPSRSSSGGKLGLQAKGTTAKRGRAKTVEKGDPRVNLVNRMSDVGERSRLQVGDIARIGTSEGWPCPAAVAGAWHRKALGWPTSGGMAGKLVVSAPSGGPSAGRILALAFHDGQGAQHTSRAFQRCLESHGMAQSMPRLGNPRDSALAESFFKTLEREFVKDSEFKAREEAKQEVFKYIELYYNRQRMHLALDYNMPCGLESDVA